MSIIKINQLVKTYDQHCVLDHIHLDVEENEFFIITGKSGCGKSTLLNIIGMLDTYDSGEVELFGEKIPKPFSKKAEFYLKKKIGYLFQNYALLENETVKYNLQFILDKKNNDEFIKKALERVGLVGYEDKKIYECSGGEQQRVAIARLLIKSCDLILADEPTGSLDPQTKEDIIQILLDLKKEGKTIVMVTHDHDLLKYADRVYELDSYDNKG